MDLHPTPFPGKRRPAGNLTIRKERDQPKPATSLTESKPKRTFGRNLSVNIAIEKPLQKPLAAKPWKPSGVSKNAQKPSKKVSSALSGAGGAKSGSNKKTHHVTFLETEPPRPPAVVDESIEVSHDDLLVCTPVFSTDTLMQETPYQSAENCSKCRFDKFETSSYWLSQIRLAELTGKHFVAAAFFRLALECKAQPFVTLQNEIKHYRDRHVIVSMKSLWDDLCHDYGLTIDQPVANFGDVDNIDTILVEQFDSKCTVEEEGNCTDDREMFKDYDIIDKPEDILEDLEAKNDEPEEIIFVKQSEDGMLQLSSSMDTPLKNFQNVESPSSNSALRSGVRKSVKIVQKKSKFIDLISTESAANTRTNRTRDSGSEPASKKKDGAIIESSNLSKTKRTSEEQYKSDHLNENAKLVEDRKSVEGREWNFQPGSI